MLLLELLGRLGAEFGAGFVRGDGFMFGAVIGKHAADFGNAPDNHEIKDQHNQPDHAFGQVANRRRQPRGKRRSPCGRLRDNRSRRHGNTRRSGEGAQDAFDPLPDRRRQEKEHADEDRQRDQDGSEPLALADRFFALSLRGKFQTLPAEPNRIPQQEHAAQDGNLYNAALVDSAQRFDLGLDGSIGAADRDRHRPAPAHHHTFDDRLSAVKEGGVRWIIF